MLSINSRVRLWKINHSGRPGCSFYFYEWYIFQQNTRVYIRKQQKKVLKKKGEKTGQFVGEKIYDKFSGKNKKQKKEVKFQEPIIEAMDSIIEEIK